MNPERKQILPFLNSFMRRHNFVAVSVNLRLVSKTSCETSIQGSPPCFPPHPPPSVRLTFLRLCSELSHGPQSPEREAACGSSFPPELPLRCSSRITFSLGSGLFLLRHRVRPDSHRRPPSEKSSLKPRGWLRALTPPLRSTLS